MLVERTVEQAAPTRNTSTGRRCAPRKSLFRGLPSAPILLGVAALAISAGGAVSAADPTLVGAGHQTTPTKLMSASALTGAGAVASSTVAGHARTDRQPGLPPRRAEPTPPTPSWRPPRSSR